MSGMDKLWTMNFVGGPLNGRSIANSYEEPSTYGKRDKATGVQYWYVPTEIDRERKTATMILNSEIVHLDFAGPVTIPMEITVIEPRDGE